MIGMMELISLEDVMTMSTALRSFDESQRSPLGCQSGHPR